MEKTIISLRTYSAKEQLFMFKGLNGFLKRKKT